MALFWFDKLAGIVPNHLTGDDPLSVVTPAKREQVEGRAMLVKRPKPLPVEAVVRATWPAAAGPASKPGSVCGVPCRPGCANAKAASTHLHPATKAEQVGEHDENIDFAHGRIIAPTSPPASATSPSSSTNGPPTTR